MEPDGEKDPSAGSRRVHGAQHAFASDHEPDPSKQISILQRSL